MAEAHVLVFPSPAQGHINSMLPFAAALLDAGIFVTFLHTDHNLRRASSVAGSPRLRFTSIPDGLAGDNPRLLGDILELERSLREVGSVSYRALLASLSSAGESQSQDNSYGVDGDRSSFPPVTCVVADGLLTWAIDAAEELGLPALPFRTSSASSFLAYQTVPELLELGELPFPVGGGGLDQPVRGVPGMDSFLRRRDLPSVFRRRGGIDGGAGAGLDPILGVFAEATAHSGTAARALVLNTSASLEGPALAHIAPRMRDVFAVGPLHAMSSAAPAPVSSLWSADDGCIAWLDGQADRSVVYLSFGSHVVISDEQLTEFLSGVVASGYPFLWVLRPDMVGASPQVQGAALREAVDAVGETRARVVAWAPQRDVLRHRAVGCFLTHAGWNSTLEAVAEGVPMVCWPFFGDQQINSRLVGAVWRNGLDMKDVCEWGVVERTVREAMESAEIRRSAEALARQVKRDVAAGGSSSAEFERLVGFIRELSATSGLSQPVKAKSPSGHPPSLKAQTAQTAPTTSPSGHLNRSPSPSLIRFPLPVAASPDALAFPLSRPALAPTPKAARRPPASKRRRGGGLQAAASSPGARRGGAQQVPAARPRRRPAAARAGGAASRRRPAAQQEQGPGRHQGGVHLRRPGLQAGLREGRPPFVGSSTIRPALRFEASVVKLLKAVFRSDLN